MRVVMPDREALYVTAPQTRIEHDLLGDRAVPADAYYGVHTLRAVENFPISGLPISIYPDLIRALACIKQAAALTNHELGMLDRVKTDAIVSACEDIRAGRLHDQFVVDVIQGGAGTSTNMRSYAEQVRRHIPRRFEVLGTDGFGRSDYRAKLRQFFEVNRYYVVVAALKTLADEGTLKADVVAKAIAKYGLDTERPDPWTV